MKKYAFLVSSLFIFCLILLSSQNSFSQVERPKTSNTSGGGSQGGSSSTNTGGTSGVSGKGNNTTITDTGGNPTGSTQISNGISFTTLYDQLLPDNQNEVTIRITGIECPSGNDSYLKYTIYTAPNTGEKKFYAPAKASGKITLQNPVKTFSYPDAHVWVIVERPTTCSKINATVTGIKSGKNVTADK